MSNDSSDKPSSAPAPFDVFRSGGSTQLPGQRFPASDNPGTPRRSGPVDQRAISDASGGPVPKDPVRGVTVLRDAAGPVHADRGSDDAVPAELADAATSTIRLQTYRVNLAERIARVKAEQKDTLEHLQQLQDETSPQDPNDDQ